MQRYVTLQTQEGWFVYDEENPDDTSAHAVVKGKGPDAEALANRIVKLLNLVPSAVSDDECDRQQLALAICPELRGLIEGKRS